MKRLGPPQETPPIFSDDLAGLPAWVSDDAELNQRIADRFDVLPSLGPNGEKQGANSAYYDPELDVTLEPQAAEARHPWAAGRLFVFVPK